MSVHGLPSPPNPRSDMWVLFVVGVAGVLLGIGLVWALLPAWLGSENGETAATAPAAADGRRIHATLFYVAQNGGELAPVSREVPLGDAPAEQARRIVEAQLQPPPSGLYSAIPAGTRVHDVYLTAKGEAFVDVSSEIVTAHPGGSLNETLTVFSIVNAITVNLPDIAAVQILVDGKEVDTLAGHVDLRHPLGRSLDWVRRE
jgi:spore germination protein GerM